jgi:signal transduction histidine kinase
VKAGIGLKNMKDRLQVFGGQLSVVSSPANGCEVKAVFSLL